MLEKLVKWSAQNFSELPWRKKRTLYRTLVSEIMLQQTTVSTVLNHFERFLKVFPSLHELAKASEEEVCIQWKGLGYYRRARNLRKAAIFLVENYQGKIPLQESTLLQIPGIGQYTARALLAMGDNQNVLSIDANLERVLARLYHLQEFKGPKLHRAIEKGFSEAQILPEMPRWGGRQVNEALMDLGRTYCQSKKASCELCPLTRSCQSYQQGDPLSYPRDELKRTKEKMHELELIRFVVRKGKQILCYQKNEKEWLSGQWELPTFIVRSTDSNIKQYPRYTHQKLSAKKNLSFKTAITKYKIQNWLVEMSEEEFLAHMKGRNRYEFRPLRWEEENFATSTWKALKKYGLTPAGSGYHVEVRPDQEKA